jgi:hypothetical protein
MSHWLLEEWGGSQDQPRNGLLPHNTISQVCRYYLKQKFVTLAQYKLFHLLCNTPSHYTRRRDKVRYTVLSNILPAFLLGFRPADSLFF